jgi:hypothetical protein
MEVVPSRWCAVSACSVLAKGMRLEFARGVCAADVQVIRPAILMLVLAFLRETGFDEHGAENVVRSIG